jgi:hypothetical protein
MTRLESFLFLLSGFSLCVIPLLVMPIYLLVENTFGVLGTVVAGILMLVGFVFYIRFLWRWWDRLDVKERFERREKYRGIYRVLSVPTDKKSISKPKDAEIRVGDFGWEAHPLRKNNLIYLQGLTEDWYMVWHAGFRPEQIEFVGIKPVSQYDWKDFEYVGEGYRNPALNSSLKAKEPCPFPVQARDNKIAMGMPF